MKHIFVALWAFDSRLGLGIVANHMTLALEMISLFAIRSREVQVHYTV
jgi:hypothetical protein